MDVTATTSAAQAKNESVSKTDKTDKHETPSVSSVSEEKKDGIGITEDTVEISEAAQHSNKTTSKGNWNDFDMDAFQSGIRDKLLESINSSKDSLKAAGVEFAEYNSDSILYDLSGLNGGNSIKAADVPEYWNAENTAQRIVDFAMNFRGLAPELSDEEYIKQIREAVELGYKLAKQDLGSLPAFSAQLFNDTYNLTMKKFDELLAQAAAKAG